MARKCGWSPVTTTRKPYSSDARFSSVPANPGYPTLSPAIAASRRADPSFLRMDRPKHTEHRRMWTPFFAIKRIQEMRPGIQAIVDETLAAMLEEKPPVDFVEKFALTVPSLVICQLLDVPKSAHAFFHQHSKTRMTMNGTPENILKAMQALDEFWETLITEREKNPGDDLVSQLIVNEVRTGRLSKRELIGMAQLMLLAGHETTANMIALGLLTLLRHPQQLERVKADKTLTPSAVDELLRYLSIAQHGLGRTAIADVEVGDVLIRAGDGVLVGRCCRRIAMIQCLRNPITSISVVRRAIIWRSVRASTSASDILWRARSCRSSLIRCSAAFQRFALQFLTRRSPTSMKACSSGSTLFP